MLKTGKLLLARIDDNNNDNNNNNNIYIYIERERERERERGGDWVQIILVTIE